MHPTPPKLKKGLLVRLYLLIYSRDSAFYKTPHALAWPTNPPPPT